MLTAFPLRWVARHWLWLLNAATALTLAGALVAPLLSAAGFAAAASAIHGVYLLLCPQRPTHSYFLLGYQLALEHREIAMFAAQLALGLAIAVPRARSSWRIGFLAFVLLSLPMTWDVGSQLLGLRDSDWLTRSWTGLLFNAAFVLWFYPQLDQSLRGSGRSIGPAPIARAAD